MYAPKYWGGIIADTCTAGSITTETAQLPCAPILPWAKTQAHGNRLICRVPRRPAHDKTKTHGKKFVCRVLANKTHGKLNTHGKTPSLPSVYFMAHGKEAVRGGMARGPCICRVPHYGKPKYLPCVFSFLSCALVAAHSKLFRIFLILHFILFVVSIHFTWDSKLSFCIFLC